MTQIKLHLSNETKFNIIFDYKCREYFIPFEVNKTVDVESGSLLYIYPEGRPDDYRQINWTMEIDTEIKCRTEVNKLFVTATQLNSRFTE